VSEVVPSENMADSAKIYEIDPKVLLKTFRRVDHEGLTMLGVFHSHTHSEAYPSPTDVRQAPDPAWHYLLVSLATSPPELRSFRVVDGQVSEESLSIEA
jgi:proteasome lid subunit RPN8/RPN11